MPTSIKGCLLHKSREAHMRNKAAVASVARCAPGPKAVGGWVIGSPLQELRAPKRHTGGKDARGTRGRRPGVSSVRETRAAVGLVRAPPRSTPLGDYRLDG
eukprot:scaffold2740_cov130-Isochrysis_galbana.AAC.2